MITAHNLQSDKPQTGKGSGRGGARKGAGRKKTYRKSVTIRLSDAKRAILDEMRGDVGISDFIRAKLGLGKD